MSPGGMNVVGMVGVRFILKGGGFVDGVFPEGKATEIVRHWSEGEYERTKQSIITNVRENMPAGQLWAICVDSISAITTFPLQQQRAA